MISLAKTRVHAVRSKREKIHRKKECLFFVGFRVDNFSFLKEGILLHWSYDEIEILETQLN